MSIFAAEFVGKNNSYTMITSEEDFEQKFQDLFGENYDAYIEGYNFEKHVVWWMNQYFGNYSLKIWQGDKIVKPYGERNKIYASWNQYPDLIYVDEQNNKVLGLECKFCTYAKFKVERQQLQNYKDFEKYIQELTNRDTRAYVIVGNNEYGFFDETVGVFVNGYCPTDRENISLRPTEMYCLPLDFIEQQLGNSDKTTIEVSNFPQYLIMTKPGGKIRNLYNHIPF